MYNTPIVPEDFVIPELLETSRMRLRPLTAKDAEKDHNNIALMYR
jgi:hypothetical protein